MKLPNDISNDWESKLLLGTIFCYPIFNFADTLTLISPHDLPVFFLQTVHFESFGPSTSILLDRSLRAFWTVYFRRPSNLIKSSGTSTLERTSKTWVSWWDTSTAKSEIKHISPVFNPRRQKSHRYVPEVVGDRTEENRINNHTMLSNNK